MRRSGGRALWVHTDVARPGSVRALLSEARNRFGRVDLLVNNAGAGGNFSRVGDVMRDHRENFSAVLAANFLGPWEAIVAARGILRTQPGGGSIVNVSTHYADHPYIFRTIYTVSKILLKALAKSARADLAADGISIVDVAPTLIAGPRMEWVMRNYATKFSGGFDDFPGLSPAGRKSLTETFLRSFDGALSAGEREAASTSFLAALRAQKMPKGARERIETWYRRIGEWFRSTVPAAPPGNEEVAAAVLFAAKDGRFLENPFLALTTLPPFSSFPPSPGAARVLSAGEPGTMVSTGDAGTLQRRLHEALSGKRARVTSLSDAELPDGQAGPCFPESASCRRHGSASPVDTIVPGSPPDLAGAPATGEEKGGRVGDREERVSRNRPFLAPEKDRLRHLLAAGPRVPWSGTTPDPAVPRFDPLAHRPSASSATGRSARKDTAAASRSSPETAPSKEALRQHLAGRGAGREFVEPGGELRRVVPHHPLHPRTGDERRRDIHDGDPVGQEVGAPPAPSTGSSIPCRSSGRGTGDRRNEWRR